MKQKIYTTALPLEGCLQILKKHAYSISDIIRFNFALPAEGTVFAKVCGNQFRLFAQGPHNVRNSFAPFFYGRLEEAIAGTRIVGQFKMHSMVRVFMAFWFGALAVVTLGFAGAAISGQLDLGFPSMLALAAPLGLFLFGFAMIRFGRRFGDGQRHNIEYFIGTQLQARSSETEQETLGIDPESRK